MFSYEETANWHTGPQGWHDESFAQHSSIGSTRAVTNASVFAGSTTRGTSVSYTEQTGISTAATTSTAATASGTGGAPVAGGHSFTFSRTDADTYSSQSGTAGSASASFSGMVPRSYTASSVWSAGVSQTTQASVTTAITRSWPSTLTTALTTGTLPATGTVSTRTCSPEVTTAVTEGTSTTATAGPEYTAADTFLSTSTTTTGTGATTTRTTSAVRHDWLAMPHTVVHPNASAGFAGLGNDVLAWHPRKLAANSSIGLFTDLFTTLASGTVSSSVGLESSRVSLVSTVWKSYALSTSEFTGTSTSTGTTGTSTATGTQQYNSIASSLDGGVWVSTAAASSSTQMYGSITGSSSYTVPGPATFTDWTYTREVTDYTTLSQFTRLTTTETFNDVSSEVVWQSWDRSYTTTAEIIYPQSTSTVTLVSSYSTNGWLLGSVTVVTDEWQTLSSSVPRTEWDGFTNALGIGTFTTSGSSGSGGNVTTESRVTSITQTFARTDYAHVRHSPTVAAQSIHEFTRPIRGFQRMMPRGFLGFGDGFAESSPVHAGLTSSVSSGVADPVLTLNGNVLPRFIFRPDASIFATGPCWKEGNITWSSISATWLTTTATGPRLTAALGHHWTSTSTGTTGASTTTATLTQSATYLLGVTGSISGNFFSAPEPRLNTVERGIGWPLFGFLASASGGGAFGGISPISAAALSMTFPAGAVTMTWESAPGVTASSSASTSTGELAVVLSTATNPVAFSYEQAMRYSWGSGTALQLESALMYHLPAHPWTQDLP